MSTETSVPTQPSVAIETHGCKLNQADSGLLASQFLEAGYRLVSTEEPADVYVLNSCTVTHVADRKARHAIRSARRRNPDATIVATGCYAQRSPQDLRTLDEVDLVAGNVDKPALVRQIADWRGEAPVPCAVGFDVHAFSPRVLRTRAMVKIQEGCDQVCAYCIVPKVRGRERSIRPDDLVGQINRRLSEGYKEVVLTGTQLGTYGFDLGDITLAGLIERILAETSVRRLRVSSLQPQEITLPMLQLWSDGRLCPHFHLPLQSGNDSVLKRMRRRYTTQQYAETVESIRQQVCGVSVTADVIAGFPGETQLEFEETLAFCERMRFASMHVFPYSVRPGTSAAHFDRRVDSETRSRRAAQLLKLAEHHGAEFRRRLLGTVRPVLWEETTRMPQLWSGLTDNYVRVVARSSRALTNEIAAARLVRQEEDLVFAQVL